MLPDSRSLNLANSVGICLYEVWRQLGFVGDIGQSGLSQTHIKIIQAMRCDLNTAGQKQAPTGGIR